MDELGGVIGVAILFALVFGLGEWLFRAFAERLESRLRAGWRWLALPIVALLCFAAFGVLRPLVLDRPRTPSWFVLGVIAIALLVAGATALAYAMVALGRWLVSVLRGR